MGKNILVCIVILFLIILLLDLISAWGVVADYNENRPLGMVPGEIRTVDFRIKNTGEEITVSASLDKGSEIASFVDSELNYLVPAGTTTVPLKIEIPFDAKDGTVYTIVVSFNSIISGDRGGIALGTAIDYGFDVVVSVPKESPVAEEEKPLMLILILGSVVLITAILLVVLIILLIKMKKTEKGIVSEQVLNR